MQNQSVTRKNSEICLTVNDILAAELPPLDAERLADLRTSIKRDGILDAVKYWHNPETDRYEIIDGHHRHKIAVELDLDYALQEIDFTGKSIVSVKYWMHINQSARRGGTRNVKRMVELQEQMGLDRPTAIKTVAKDAKASTRTVQRNVKDAQTQGKPDVDPLDHLMRVISKLPQGQQKLLVDRILELIK